MSTYRVEVVKAELVGLWRAYWEDDDPCALVRLGLNQLGPVGRLTERM
jgi:hypothetical protein